VNGPGLKKACVATSVADGLIGSHPSAGVLIAIAASSPEPDAKAAETA
jgi:hypothetical protein